MTNKMFNKINTERIKSLSSKILGGGRLKQLFNNFNISLPFFIESGELYD